MQRDPCLIRLHASPETHQSPEAYSLSAVFKLFVLEKELIQIHIIRGVQKMFIQTPL